MDGTLPEALTRAGAEFSKDSVWWLFKKLGEKVAENFAARTPRVQAEWSALESDFEKSAAEVEAQAQSLQATGKTADASSLLTLFMEQNLDRVLTQLKKLLTEFGE
jgi:dipeptidase